MNPWYYPIVSPYDVSTFFINGELTFINGSRHVLTNFFDYITIDSRVFDSYIMPNELFADKFQSIQICLSVNG